MPTAHPPFDNRRIPIPRDRYGLGGIDYPHLQFAVVAHFANISTSGDAYGIRTRVTAVKGRCLRPLDQGAIYKMPSGNTTTLPAMLRMGLIGTPTVSRTPVTRL